MSAIQYPFIDIAVHPDVRARFARGEALALFSRDMTQVLWANGDGAAFFGNGSIYDFIDQGPNRQDVSFRQIATSGLQLSTRGDSRGLMVRVPSGFRRMAVQATVEMVQVKSGETAVLFSVPVDRDLAITARAERMLSGFDDPDTHMAMLDDQGHVVAASGQFKSLGLTDQTARALVDLVGSLPERLLKRPVPTGRGHLPAAVGKVADAPGLFLLFVVETVLGDMNPSDSFGDGAPASSVAATAVEPAAPSFAAVVDALGDIEDIEDLDDNLAPEVTDFAAAALEEDNRDAATMAEPAEPDTTEAAPAEAFAEDEPGEAEAAPASSPLHQDDAEVPALIAEAATLEPTVSAVVAPREPLLADEGSATLVPPFVFNRAARALRFVWKIDAEGRFSEVSEEFAAAVGPRAADINGLAFGDVSALFNLDPSGKIAELLKKRDTWSGKTIYWPVEGTSLKVPVDLAALPTYGRNRDFDGFRGFGVVRSADAIEDPDATGLTFVATETVGQAVTEALMEASPEEASEAHTHLTEASDWDATAATPFPDQTGEATAEPVSPVEQNGEEPDHPTIAAEGSSSAEQSDDDDLFIREDNTATPSPLITPTSEPPALRIVENDSRRLTDKIIQLEERRSRGADGLTPHEQAAFREIARKLDPNGNTVEPMPSVRDSASSTSVRGEPELPTDDAVEAESHPAPNVVSISAVEPAFPSPPVPARLPGDRVLSPEVVDMLPLALLVHRGDVLIHANPEFLNLTGYESLEALDQAGGLDALLEREDVAGATEQAGQVVVVRSDDELVPVSARLQSIRWEPDHTSALMLALTPAGAPRQEARPTVEIQPPEQDSERELARLKVETEELRSILETATDGVVLLDADGEIRSMNRSASALFNYDDAETKGKPFVMLFAHESQKAILDYLNGLTDNGVASVLNDGREVIGREASGGFLPLFMTIGRLSSSNGYCAVIRDITQWKRTEEELRSAKRAAETANAHKTDFLARVSHEIRTPLNAIIGFADMMASEHFGPIGNPRYTEYAGDIGRSGRHVLDIVNDLLDISKIEAGEMDLEFVAVGLNETVASAVSIVQPQANSQRVIIRTALSQAVPLVVADVRSIKQIVLNILANAIRFTPSGGQIIVSTAYESNGSVVLRVRDTGVGMSRAELEQAMKPFRQVATGGRGRNDGTGLGLPLTKAMVDANRANFSIHSTPNEGTLVEIVFPSPRVLAG